MLDHQLRVWIDAILTWVSTVGEFNICVEIYKFEIDYDQGKVQPS